MDTSTGQMRRLGRWIYRGYEELVIIRKVLPYFDTLKTENSLFFQIKFKKDSCKQLILEDEGVGKCVFLNYIVTGNK